MSEPVSGCFVIEIFGAKPSQNSIELLELDELLELLEPAELLEILLELELDELELDAELELLEILLEPEELLEPAELLEDEMASHPSQPVEGPETILWIAGSNSESFMQYGKISTSIYLLTYAEQFKDRKDSVKMRPDKPPLLQ